MTKTMHVVTLCGSLRQASINAVLLDTLGSIAPKGTTVAPCQLIADLPLFNPDLSDNLPEVVRRMEKQIRDADVIVMASPEYAHGISGVCKNALDWLVGSEAYVNKPVVILNAAPRAQHADAALREVLTVMSAQIISAASLTIAIAPASRSPENMATDRQILQDLQKVWQAITEFWQTQPATVSLLR